DDRARHQPAAEDAVDLGDSGRSPRRRFVEADLGRGDGPRRRDAGRKAGGPLLDEAVPLATARALAEPLGLGVPARLTAMDVSRRRRSLSGHGATLDRGSDTRALGTHADPVGTVGAGLLLPDRRALLELVDQGLAGAEGLAAVGRGGRHRDGDVTD